MQHDYAPSDMTDVFRVLQRAGDQQGSALPSWLSTHPDPAERIELVQQRISQLTGAQRGSRRDVAEYLGEIDGLVYGNDPRHGFFRDGTFYHPDLRFQFSVPSQWSTQNLSQAVIAVSPSRDAIVQLTLPGASNPTSAARQFMAQPNVRAVQSSPQRLNGLPAVVTIFDAMAGETQVRGIAAHVSHRGRMYQLIGYTPYTLFPQYGSAIEEMISSFGPLRDASILNITPRRIDIVRLARSMTLADFAREYNATIPISDLAAINQVTSAESVLPAGSLVKRVS
jgi:predicted Zn-dependent protease